MAISYDKANPLMMSASILLGLEQAAVEVSLDLSPILNTVGVSHRQICSGEGTLALHKVVDVLNKAAEASSCEYFGLLIAKHQPPARFAMIGQLIRFSNNLGMAINDAIQFSLLNSEFTRWETRAEHDSFSVIRKTRANLDVPMFQLRTLAIAVVYKAINAICQRRINLRQVNFSVASPARPERFEQFFGAPVLFNQMESSLVLSTTSLETPLPTADPQVRALLLEHLQRVVETQSPASTLVDRVRLYIERTIGSRECHLEGLCASWGVHPRSLQRSLQEHGTSFRQLLIGIRHELADQYLRDTSIPVSELSDILGYANASAFSRAFKQVSGMAPEPWRASQNDMQNVVK